MLGEQEDLLGRRLFHVDDNGKRVVVDVDQLGRVGAAVAAVGHDGDDRLTHEPDGVTSERPSGESGVDLRKQGARHQGPEVSVGAREHPDHPGRLSGRGNVDRTKPGVGHRRAHEHDP